MVRTILWRVAYLGLLFLPAGCGGGTTLGTANKTYDRLAWIGEAYMKATDELDHAPASVEDLRPYLSKRGDVAEILRSDNDGQDFVILWGVDYRTYVNEQKRYPVTAYEKNGKGGLRYVLQMRVVSPMTNDTLAKMDFPPGKSAPN